MFVQKITAHYAVCANMSEDECWSIVEECQWNKDHDYNRIKKFLMKKYSREQMHEFNDFVQKKCGLLSKAIKQAEKSGKEFDLPYGGDSWSDLLNHMVGSGKAAFEKALANPKSLEKTKYVESFSYAIPFARISKPQSEESYPGEHDDDYDRLSEYGLHSRFEKYARVIENLAKNKDVMSVAGEEVKEVCTIIQDIRKKQYDKIPEKKAFKKLMDDIEQKLEEELPGKVYKQLPSLERHGLENIALDMQRHLKD